MLNSNECSVTFNSKERDDFTPDRLPGANNLCPVLVVVPGVGSQCVVKYTMMSSGRQLVQIFADVGVVQPVSQLSSVFVPLLQGFSCY